MKHIVLLVVAIVISASAIAEPPAIRFDGFGPITVGMKRAAVIRALGQKPERSPDAEDEECEYFIPNQGLEGISFMFSYGRLARIDVDKGKTPTDSGLRIGDSMSRIRKAYPKGVTVTARQYIPSPHGKYVTVKSPDGKFAIRFETHKGRIVTFYSGRFPEVEFVARCA